VRPIRKRPPAEWDGTFRSDIATFLSEDLIELATDRNRPLELAPQPNIKYQCFVDASGGRHDHYTCCVGHRAGDRFVVDVL
jgi:hypothetical protein